MLNLGVSGFPGAVREYTLRVKAILAILIMTAVVVLPVFAGQSGSCGDCCIPAEDVQATSSQDDCCESLASQDDDNSKSDHEDSCEGCDCPLRCCVVVTKIPVFSSSVTTTQFARAPRSIALFAVRGDVSDPHLHLLKRPPRA